ncbi:Peroxisomal membrane protein [Yarrowia sp. C11]|nr:Peroxisomal membrane protein [Yarrowia sp. E02]KAG5373161.1 Peroxisomal membrane protein [Yarrowia sp. C11]
MSVCLAQNPTVTRVVKLLETHVGRDKILRSIQYFSRFLTYYLFRKGYTKDTIDIFRKIQNQFSMARKLFRVGKPIGHLKTAAVSFENKTMDPCLRYTTIGRNLGYAIYLVFDSIIYVNGSGIKKIDNIKTIKKVGSYFWAFGIFCNILNSIHKINICKKKRAALAAEKEKDTTSAKKNAKDAAAAQKQLVWDLLDFSIPLTSLGYLHLDDGLVGLAGFATGIMGVQKAWAATA